MKTRNVVRVTIEYTDGAIDALEGAEAAKWEEAVDAQAAFCFVHDQEFPKLDWTHVRGSTSASPPGGADLDQ